MLHSTERTIAPRVSDSPEHMEESKAVLKRRGALMEAIFGQIKTVRGAARFMRLLSLVKTNGA
ncbi:MAG: hypothetical protein ACYC9S_10305 [Leptospirales bacterium]